jgi:hypothetical protein
MTAVHNRSGTHHENENLAPVLRAAHEAWICETSGFLSPILVQDAPFWNRWTAVRYLADQFQVQYGRERALVDELRPFLPPVLSDRLTQDGERIAHLQRKLDRVGRRRGTAHTVSVVSRELLRSLRSWCAEIEAAAGQIPRDLLPEEGGRLVAEFELFIRTRS